MPLSSVFLSSDSESVCVCVYVPTAFRNILSRPWPPVVCTSAIVTVAASPSRCEFLDGSVVIRGGQRLQRAPAVSVELDDLHQERTRQLGLGRTQHLIPHGGQQLRHHLRQLILQQESGALELRQRQQDIRLFQNNTEYSFKTDTLKRDERK